MKPTLLVILAVMLLVAPTHAASKSGVEDVLIDSWVYDALIELSAHRSVPQVLLHTRPLARRQVADAITDVGQDGRPQSAGESIILRRLADEFREELTASDTVEHRARLGGGPTSRLDHYHDRYTSGRGGFDAIGSFTVSDAVSTRLRVRFDSDGREDSQFHGEYWKEKFTAWVEQAVTVARWKRFTAAFGREYWRWGLSPHDVMLLSDNSPPFNGLRVMYQARNWSYAFHAAELNQMTILQDDYPGGIGPTGQANRYLVAHRFNWRPRHNLELAVSEVHLFGGIDRGWQWSYLNPFLPYYWEQLNNDTNDNPLWNLELSWRVIDGLQFYGEWMIDDFQIDFESEPHQIGVLAGIQWIPNPFDGRLALNAEYQRLNTFVYGQTRPWNRYVHHVDLHGQPIGIGSNLGTDADRVTLAPLYHLSQHIDLRGRLEHIRRGENRISDPQFTAVPKGLPFPSGTVEDEWRIAIGSSLNYRGQIVASATVGHYQIDNYAHIENESRQGPYFQFRLNMLIWKTFRV